MRFVQGGELRIYFERPGRGENVGDGRRLGFSLVESDLRVYYFS